MSHEAWLEQAENDLAAAKVLGGANHHSQAVWFAAQAVEKGHKAILAALGLQYEEKHYKKLGHETGEIAKLLPEALQQPMDLAIASKVSKLESRALTCRYPQQDPAAGQVALRAPASLITTSAQEIADAEALLGWCRERITRATRAAEAMRP